MRYSQEAYDFVFAGSEEEQRRREEMVDIQEAYDFCYRRFRKRADNTRARGQIGSAVAFSVILCERNQCEQGHSSDFLEKVIL